MDRRFALLLVLACALGVGMRWLQRASAAGDGAGTGDRESVERAAAGDDAGTSAGLAGTAGSSGESGSRVEATVPDESMAEPGAAAAVPGDTWTIRVLPKLTEIPGAEPRTIHFVDALLVYDGGTRDLLASLQFVGQELEFKGTIPTGAFDVATLALSTTPAGLQGDDGRVFFGASAYALRGGARLAESDSIDARAKTVDLGEVELVPPTSLGSVVFPEPVAEEHSLFVGVGAPPREFARVFESRGLGTHTDIEAGTDIVVCSSFAESDSWFVTVKDRFGREVYFGTERRGTDIVVTP